MLRQYEHRSYQYIFRLIRQKALTINMAANDKIKITFDGIQNIFASNCIGD